MDAYERFGYDLVAALENNHVTLTPCNGYTTRCGDTLTIDMIDHVIDSVDGDSDGSGPEADYLWLVMLKDGRYAFIFGNCDNTGWDCQSSCDAYVGHSVAQLRQFGMRPEHRERFEIQEG